eukprot:gene6261-7508_t
MIGAEADEPRRERLDVPEGAGFASAGSLDAKERAEASTRVASQFISSNLLKRPGSAPVESSTKVAGTIYTRSHVHQRLHLLNMVFAPHGAMGEESEPPTPEQPTTPTKMSATLAERLSPGWTPLSPATPGGDVYAIPTPGYQSTPQRAPPDKAASASQCTPMSARGDSSDPPSPVGLTKGWDQDKEIEQTGLSKLIQVKKDRSTKDAINMALNKESEHELCNDPNSPKNMRRRKKENQQFLKESLKSLRYMQDVLNKL